MQDRMTGPVIDERHVLHVKFWGRLLLTATRMEVHSGIGVVDLPSSITKLLPSEGQRRPIPHSVPKLNVSPSRAGFVPIPGFGFFNQKDSQGDR